MARLTPVHLRKVVEQTYPGSTAAKTAREYLAAEHVAKSRRAPALTGPSIQRVTVVDIDISFARLVSLFVKWSIALIPATIILALIGLVVVAALAGV
jgi:hypothetical protein